jgi:hypothetical protein
LAEVERIRAGSKSRPAVVRAEVTELAPDRWSVRLTTDVGGETGERVLEANTCAALASATALIVAWTIDPSRSNAVSPEAEPTSHTEPAAPAPSSAPVASTGAAAPGASSKGLSVLLGASAVGDVGTLPRLAVGGNVTLGVILPSARFELSGIAWANQDATWVASEGSHLQQLEAGLRACWRWVRASGIELDPCAGVGVAHLSSNGFGETTQYQRDAWWGSAQVVLLSNLHIGGIPSLRPEVGLVVPWSRPSVILVDGQGMTIELHQPSVIAGRAGLGLEVQFP